jgi:hypothetical protein
LQLAGDERVFGFHPTVAALEQAGGAAALTDWLIAHVAQDSAVQDDTLIFRRAHALAQQGERTTVWQIAYELSAEEFERVRTMLLEWYNTGQVFRYNFPKADGSFNPGECNCALFPKLLGLTVPSENGNLRTYIEAMAGGKLWQP